MLLDLSEDRPGQLDRGKLAALDGRGNVRNGRESEVHGKPPQAR